MDFILSLCHFCELHGPQVLICTQSHKKASINNLHIPENSLNDSKKCHVCQPLANEQIGFKSYDSSGEIIFISSSNAIPIELHPVTKYCCTRSISCEQFPGQWGTIYYGSDRDNCHIMACKFPLKDFYARGFQQTYCVNVLSPDKSELLCNWSFICTRINDIVSWLQHHSKTQFDQDSILPKQKGVYEKIFVISSKKTRSLSNITNNENIFEEVHLRFSHLLNDLSQLYEVKLNHHIPSPPVINFKHFEESDGFVKLLENKNFSNITSPEEIDLNEFNGDLYPRYLYKFLGRTNFEMILQYVVIGNQVIVRCNQKLLIKSIIDCFLSFIPQYTKQFDYFSKDYIESSNLLGLVLSPTLPVIKRTCLILDISGHISNRLDNIPKDLRNENPLLNRHFIITHENLPNIRQNVPTYVDKILQFLKNENLDNEVVNLCINALKIEWINKVKNFEKNLTMMNSVSKKDEDKLIKIVGASKVDFDLIQFWKFNN